MSQTHSCRNLNFPIFYLWDAVYFCLGISWELYISLKHVIPFLPCFALPPQLLELNNTPCYSCSPRSRGLHSSLVVSHLQVASVACERVRISSLLGALCRSWSAFEADTCFLVILWVYQICPNQFYCLYLLCSSLRSSVLKFFLNVKLSVKIPALSVPILPATGIFSRLYTYWSSYIPCLLPQES